MSKLSLTLACGLYDRVLPLYTGEVQPAGVDLNFIAIDNPREAFDRMVGKNEFDISEMSSSEYVTRFAAGKNACVALPVFVSRVFRHGFIAVDSRVIEKPKDLEGKRIGVQLYTMTAAIWIRGILQHHYGVDFSGVEWVEGALDSPHPHGRPTILPPLEPIAITQNTTGRSLSELLEAGEIAATVGAELPPAFGRNPNVQRLFPDFRQAEKDYYRATKIFPIMHLIVVRRELYQKFPFLASTLYEAFCASKEIAYGKMRYLGALRYMLPWMAAELEEIDEVFGGDPWPYGIEPNRHTLDALVQYLVDQSLIRKAMTVDELFAPVFERADRPRF